MAKKERRGKFAGHVENEGERYGNQTEQSWDVGEICIWPKGDTNTKLVFGLLFLLSQGFIGSNRRPLAATLRAAPARVGSRPVPVCEARGLVSSVRSVTGVKKRPQGRGFTKK
jgi:hypothetical protein